MYRFLGQGGEFSIFNPFPARVNYTNLVIISRIESQLLSAVWSRSKEDPVYIRYYANALRKEYVKLSEGLKTVYERQRAVSRATEAGKDAYNKLTDKAVEYKKALIDLNQQQEEFVTTLFKLRGTRLDEAFDKVDLESKYKGLLSKDVVDSFDDLHVMLDAQSHKYSILSQKITDSADMVERYKNKIVELQASLEKVETGGEEYQKLAASLTYYKNLLRETELAHLSNKIALEELGGEAEDFLGDLISKGYKAELEAYLESMQDKVDAEEDRHTAYMKNLDDERQALERQWSSEDFTDKLKELDEELSKLRVQSASLALDTSATGIKMTEEINASILEKEKERDAFIRDREHDQLLQGIDDKQEAEETKYEDTKEMLDKEKEKTEQHYNDLIEYAEYYAQGLLNAYEDGYTGLYELLSDKFVEFKALEEEYTKLIFFGSQGSISPVDTTFSGYPYNMSQADYDSFLANSAEWMSIFNQLEDKDVRTDRMDALHAANDALRQKYAIPANADLSMPANLPTYNIDSLVSSLPAYSTLDQSINTSNVFNLDYTAYISANADEDGVIGDTSYDAYLEMKAAILREKLGYPF